MKKIFICISIIFSLFCFCGCKSSEIKDLSSKDYILLSTQLLSQGQIIENVAFSVNFAKIKKLTSSQEEQTTFLSNLIDMANKRRDEFLFSYALKYLSSPNENFKIGQGVVLSDVAYFQESDSIGFSIVFASLESFNYYHKSEAQRNLDGKAKRNIFFNKSSSLSNFVFSAKTSDDEMVGQKWEKDYLQACKGLSFENALKEQYNPMFLYSYASPYRSLHSNSDLKTDVNGLYYHIWGVSNDDLTEDIAVQFWQYQINYKMWYLSIFLIVLLFIAISLFVIKIKGKKIF